jgi:hypothetical protein
MEQEADLHIRKLMEEPAQSMWEAMPRVNTMVLLGDEQGMLYLVKVRQCTIHPEGLEV